MNECTRALRRLLRAAVATVGHDGAFMARRIDACDGIEWWKVTAPTGTVLGFAEILDGHTLLDFDPQN